MKKFIGSKIKKLFLKFFLIDDTPHKVAAGAALGVFLGIIPGEGVIATLILATLLRFNRLAATAGVLATNMWVTLLVLPLAAIFGGFMFNKNSQDLIMEFNRNYDLGYEFLLTKPFLLNYALPLVLGFLAVAGIIALLVYFLLFYLLKTKKIKFSDPDKKIIGLKFP